MMLLRLLFASFFLISVSYCGALQDAIDRAKPGSKIILPPGTYKGAIVITKPLSIVSEDPKNKAVIDAGGKGTVVSVKSSYVTLKDLKIVNSGNRNEKLDSAIRVENAAHCEISGCEIKECLFGIDLQMVKDSIVVGNLISSKNLELGLRGDGIRLWSSSNNVIRDNKLINSRDFVVWYSHGNKIIHNYGRNNRYSLHFMYAGRNLIEDNYFELNSVGMFFMYSKDSIAKNNIVKSSQGATGMGIGLKDVSNFTITGNKIVYCAIGIYIDRSPFDPQSHNIIQSNRILYNAEAFHFHSLSEHNIIRDNIIAGNIEDVINDSEEVAIDRNEIEENFWDSYEGFDRNKDGIGDTPHRVYQYADQIWMYNPDVKFFYASPVMTLLNFLAKLAPFTKPRFLFEDPKPKIQKIL